MKKIYFLLLAIVPVILCAQPTINNMMVMPIGSSYTMLKDSTLGVNSGSSGANQTWNFSSVIPTIPNTARTYLSIDPATAPFIDSFPAANFVINVNNGSQYNYFNNTGNNTFMIGNYDTMPSFTFFQNSQLCYQRPFTYLNTFTDTFSFTYFYVDMHDASGNETVTADAYGTVITPVATYPNCLRIFTVQPINDTDLVDSSIFSYIDYYYAWYDGVHFAPVFEFDSLMIDTSVYYSVRHLSNETSGINEISPNKAIGIVFPNPGKDQFTLCYHLNSSESMLQIKDITGRLVYKETISGNLGNTIIKTSELSNGTYLWEITNNDGIEAKGKLSVLK